VVKKISLSPITIGILQTAGFLVYASGVAWLMMNGNNLFGKTPNLIGPMLFLALFVFSAIFSAGILLGYPFYVFWEKKDFKTAFKIVASSTIFLFAFIILTLWLLLATRL
jgi:hypothetical protein